MSQLTPGEISINCTQWRKIQFTQGLPLCRWEINEINDASKDSRRNWLEFGGQRSLWPHKTPFWLKDSYANYDKISHK